jgi:hypothetical protein
LPANAGSISGTTTVCQGQNSLMYAVPTIANAISYVWILPNGATGYSTTNSIAVSYNGSAVSGIITVQGNNTCGDGSSSAMSITVNQLPSSAGTINGASSICLGQGAVNYSVPSIANATSYVWTLPSGATGASSTNNITVNYGTMAVSGLIEVYGQNICGVGSTSTIAVSVTSLMPANAGTISGTTNVCQGQNSVIYAVPTIANATSYVWTIPNGTTGSSTTNSIIVNYGSSAVSGGIEVFGQNGCGSGNASIIAVYVNTMPSTPLAILNGNVLQSSSVTGNQWYNQNGIIIGATSQYYTPTVNGNYYVIVTTNGCGSNPSNTINYVVTGVLQNMSDNAIKIYPNPVTDELILEMDGNNSKLDFEILNTLGQVVFKGNLTEKTVVPTSNFSQGVYLIKLDNGKTFDFKKIVKE